MKLLKMGAFCIGLLITSLSFGQTTLQKVNNTAGDINSAKNAAANTVSDVSSTVKTANDVKNTLSGLFVKKKKGKTADGEQEKEPAKDTVQRSPMITISITGIDYAGLKAFEDNLKAIKGVNSVSKKFNSTTSSLEVSFTGKGDQLWDLLPAPVSSLFTLKDLGDQAISLEVKK